MYTNENGNLNQKQQGDVLFARIDSLPKDLSPVARKERGFVLAEGEATGHAHTISDGIRLYQDSTGGLFVHAETTATVVHEEHGPITLEVGFWKIGQVREMDHMADVVRTVTD